MSNFLNIHEETLYLKGARDLICRFNELDTHLTFGQGKEDRVYSKAVLKEILENRESLVKFLQGSGWRYTEHQRDKKNKLISVKVEFNK
jgi:hypothetical protein